MGWWFLLYPLRDSVRKDLFVNKTLLLQRYSFLPGGKTQSEEAVT